MPINTGKIIADLRKEKELSQTDLAHQSGVSREMIGKYERGEAVPSIEAAKKIADAFAVSLDYLVGQGVNASFDKKNLKRLQDIEKLDTDTKEKIYFVIDNIIQNVKAKKAFAS
jgi:transcriptional regulator with XRE-family HTH domain